MGQKKFTFGAKSKADKSRSLLKTNIRALRIRPNIPIAKGQPCWKPRSRAMVHPLQPVFTSTLPLKMKVSFCQLYIIVITADGG